MPQNVEAITISRQVPAFHQAGDSAVVRPMSLSGLFELRSGIAIARFRDRLGFGDVRCQQSGRRGQKSGGESGGGRIFVEQRGAGGGDHDGVNHKREWGLSLKSSATAMMLMREGSSPVLAALTG